MEKQSAPQLIAGKVAKITVVELECLLDEQQAADVLGLAVKTLRNDRSTADLGVPFVRLSGRAIRYRPGDLREFIEARLVRPAAVTR